MKLTLLVDLDDTLLGNRMELFEPAYLKALGKHLSNHVKPEFMLRELLSATQCMIHNDRPDRSLEDTFDEAFYPALGTTKAALNAVISQFYATIFPGLKSITSVRPDAIRFIQWAFSKGCQVVVATNPLFPQSAIYQRLSWAGFPPDETPFSLITSYENFHFAKPNMSYYAEILAQLGWPEGPVVMVGNDMKDDIQPAAALGLQTFWVNRNRSTISPSLVNKTASGDLDNLVAWLESAIDPLSLHIKSSAAVYTTVLRANLAAFLSLTKMKKAFLQFLSLVELEKFSPILTQWLDIEVNDFQPWILRTINQDDLMITPRAYDEPARAVVNKTIMDLVNDFRTNRLRTLALLSLLSSQDWEQRMIFTPLGKCTFLDMIGYMVDQDCAMMHACWQASNQGI